MVRGVASVSFFLSKLVAFQVFWGGLNGLEEESEQSLDPLTSLAGSKYLLSLHILSFFAVKEGQTTLVYTETSNPRLKISD